MADSRIAALWSKVIGKSSQNPNRIFFEAIKQFRKQPERNSITVYGRYIAKEPFLRLLRFTLPPYYRTYTDDKELIDKLYLSQGRDENLRTYLNNLLPEEAHEELKQTNLLPLQEQNKAQESWVDRWAQKKEEEKEKPVAPKPKVVTEEEADKPAQPKETSKPPQEVPKPPPVMQRDFSEEEKRQAAYHLWEKVNKHGVQMKTEEGRQALLANPQSKVTKADLKTVLDHGLILGADIAPKIPQQRFLNSQGHIDQDKWNKALFEAAAKSLEEQRQQRPVRPEPTPPPTPVNRVVNPQNIGEKFTSKLPSLPRISSVLKNLGNSSPVQNTISWGLRGASRALNRYGATIAFSALGGGAGALVTGTAAGSAIGALGGGFISSKIGGIVAKGAAKGGLKLAGRGALAAAGLGSGPVGWALLALSMAPQLMNISKKTVKIVMYSLIGVITIIILQAINFFDTEALVGPFTEKGEAAELRPPGSGGQISSCTFYRNGSGVKLSSSSGLAPFIEDVAARVGVPSSVVAAILRIECETCFTTSDPTYLSNDWDDHNSFSGGVPVAFGATQFTIPTFNSIATSQTLKTAFPQKTGYITTGSKLTGITDPGKGNLLDSSGNQITQARYNSPTDPLYKQSTESLMRIYSVRDSIIAAAVKIKIDVGKNAPYNQDDINRIVSAYFGASDTSYQQAVWKSYSECKGPSTPIVPPVACSSSSGGCCPVPNGGVNTYSKDNNYPGVTDQHRHCTSAYIGGSKVLAQTCSDSPGTAYAIDVAKRNPDQSFNLNQDVFMPPFYDPATQKYNNVTCKYVGPDFGRYAGQLITQFKCVDDVNNRYFWIQFHHLQNNYTTPKDATVKTGDWVGRIDRDDQNYHHTHIQIGAGGDCGAPGSSGCQPAEQFLQCSNYLTE